MKIIRMVLRLKCDPLTLLRNSLASTGSPSKIKLGTAFISTL